MVLNPPNIAVHFHQHINLNALNKPFNIAVRFDTYYMMIIKNKKQMSKQIKSIIRLIFINIVDIDMNPFTAIKRRNNFSLSTLNKKKKKKKITRC